MLITLRESTSGTDEGTFESTGKLEAVFQIELIFLGTIFAFVPNRLVDLFVLENGSKGSGSEGGKEDDNLKIRAYEPRSSLPRCWSFREEILSGRAAPRALDHILF